MTNLISVCQFMCHVVLWNRREPEHQMTNNSNPSYSTAVIYDSAVHLVALISVYMEITTEYGIPLWTMHLYMNYFNILDPKKDCHLTIHQVYTHVNV